MAYFLRGRHRSIYLIFMPATVVLHFPRLDPALSPALNIEIASPHTDGSFIPVCGLFRRTNGRLVQTNTAIEHETGDREESRAKVGMKGVKQRRYAGQEKSFARGFNNG
jgi:hypothetical protein